MDEARCQSHGLDIKRYSDLLGIYSFPSPDRQFATGYPALRMIPLMHTMRAVDATNPHHNGLAVQHTGSRGR